MKKTSVSPTRVLRTGVMVILFLALTMLLYFGFSQDKALTATAQMQVYSLGLGMLLAALTVLWLAVQTGDTDLFERVKDSRWFYPVAAGVLALVCMILAYTYLGVWPLGSKSLMVVDMHHQYLPLLSKLRDMFLHGGSPLYSFDVGMGASFLPLFSYYLASPFNLLLVLFPENLLTEGVLVITLLKNALTAAFFAACVQYVYHRRTIAIPITAVMYSLMMYLIAYSWNIMWLDCVMVLPLIVMGFEKLMRTGRYLPYVLPLAYALYANYYIAFMICIFMVIYYVAYVLRKSRPVEKLGAGFLRFAAGSALAGGLVMFLIIPTYMALSLTSAAGGKLPEMSTNFNMFELLGRHLYDTSPTIRSGNLPNIYCGLLPVLLLPIFATMRTIPLRRRCTYLGMLAVLALSFVLNQFDLLWHGLHAPNDLPYRFSFLYSFVLLLIAYETLLHLKEINLRQVVATAAGLLAFLILQEQFDAETYSFKAIYISLLVVAIYAVILALTARRRIASQSAYCLLLLVVVTEMTINAGGSFLALNNNEYFTNHSDYLDNETSEAIRGAVHKAEEIGDKDSDGAFYRMEFLPRRTSVDTALFQYRGITNFASSNYYSTTKFMGNVGFAINGVNSHLYHSFVAPIDSLLGIKYVALTANMTNHAQLKKVSDVTVGDTTYYIYENTLALPIGYVVNADVKTWTASTYNQFRSQNDLFTALTGLPEEMYQYQNVAVKPSSSGMASTTGTYGFQLTPNGEETGEFAVQIEEDGQYFAYLDCRAASSMRIECTSSSLDMDVRPGEPYIIDAGTLSAGDEISVKVTADTTCSGNIYIVKMDPDVLDSAMQKLAAGGLNVTSFNDRQISGTVDAPAGGVFFTSIPYDAGWSVKVDGKPVETYSACDAMLAFDIAAGSHMVEISFFPRGLWLGIGISLVSLVLLILLVWFTRRRVPAAVGAESTEMPGDLPLMPPAGSAEESAVPGATEDSAGSDTGTEAAADPAPSEAPTAEEPAGQPPEPEDGNTP